MNETSKTKALYPELFSAYVKGLVLDIGSGQDPVSAKAVCFDKDDGDAERILDYFQKNQFDTVYASHCLEHMKSARESIREWFELVKPGGFLFIIVPDEDYYEQGFFPSLFNSDHKSTFTIAKTESWSSSSINCIELADSLKGELVYIKQQLDNYSFYSTLFRLSLLYRNSIQTALQNRNVASFLRYLRLLPVDQTSSSNNVLAQICFIVRKY